MNPGLAALIEQKTGHAVRTNRRLSGGLNSSITGFELSDGPAVVVKSGLPGSHLHTEGFMLDYLRKHSGLPVPRVYHAEDTLLIMDWIKSSGALTDAAQIHGADLLAALHTVRSDTFGLSDETGEQRDTLIGSLHQPNPATGRWLDFFRDQRLLYMADQGLTAAHLPVHTRKRIDRLAAKLENWIEEPAHPSLIHGDLWAGNVLCTNNQISGFIDPAIYYAHAEIELAFSTLFATFERVFFDRYREHRAIAPGFFEERRDLYNLYPLLVHVRLFGGHYVAAVDRTLERFGC